MCQVTQSYRMQPARVSTCLQLCFNWLACGPLPLLYIKPVVSSAVSWSRQQKNPTFSASSVSTGNGSNNHKGNHPMVTVRPAVSSTTRSCQTTEKRWPQWRATLVGRGKSTTIPPIRSRRRRRSTATGSQRARHNREKLRFPAPPAAGIPLRHHTTRVAQRPATHRHRRENERRTRKHWQCLRGQHRFYVLLNDPNIFRA